MTDIEENSKRVLGQSVQVIVDAAHGASSAAGWWDDTDKEDRHVIPAKLMLIVSEIAEAMEGDRKSISDDKLPHRKMFEVELADAMIRIADLAGAYDLDLGGAVVEKMAYNKTRVDHRRENRASVGGKAY